jgi:putative transposase
MLGQQQWEVVHERRSEGRSISAIARELDLDRKTVRSCLRQASWQPYRRADAASLLDAHRQWLTERAPEVNYSARILWQELRAQRGFAGSYVIVRRAVAPPRLAASVADEFTKEGLAIEVDGRIRSGRVIEVLSRLVSQRGPPAYLRCDNGPEFVARAVLKWIVDQGIGTAFIDPGKPWQNGVGESFNGKFRDECLSLEWFRSRAEAKVVIETWRRHYNMVRPHSSLGYLTPAAFAAMLEQQTAAPTTATGRGAALAWGFAPRPVASPSREGHSKPTIEVPVSS